MEHFLKVQEIIRQPKNIEIVIGNHTKCYCHISWFLGFCSWDVDYSALLQCSL